MWSLILASFQMDVPVASQPWTSLVSKVTYTVSQATDLVLLCCHVQHLQNLGFVVAGQDMASVPVHDLRPAAALSARRLEQPSLYRINLPQAAGSFPGSPCTF